MTTIIWNNLHTIFIFNSFISSQSTDMGPKSLLLYNNLAVIFNNRELVLISTMYLHQTGNIKGCSKNDFRTCYTKNKRPNFFQLNSGLLKNFRQEALSIWISWVEVHTTKLSFNVCQMTWRVQKSTMNVTLRRKIPDFTWSKTRLHGNISDG